jgi:hypothetical protein
LASQVWEFGADDEKGHWMATKSEDQAQVEAREKAAMLLKDRHERESEALAALMAAVSRRATAEEVVKRETEQIASRLAEMSRLGFDDATLAELGIDLADVRAAPASRPLEPPAETGAEGEAAATVRSGAEHDGVVRTTAHLSGSLLDPRAAGVATHQ